jgi:hypothetical protein
VESLFAHISAGLRNQQKYMPLIASPYIQKSINLPVLLGSCFSEIDAPSFLQLSVEAKRLFFIAALLLPLRTLHYPAGKGGKQAPASSYIIKDSIKWRVREADGVEHLHAAASELLEVHRQLGVAQGREEG